MSLSAVFLAVPQTSREVSSESEEEAGSEAQGKRTKVVLLYYRHL